MPFQFTLLTNSVGLELPQSLVAWGLIFLYVAIIYWRLSVWQRSAGQTAKFQPLRFVFLFILIPFTVLFLAFRSDLPGDASTSIYSLNGEILTIPILAALPWMLAGGLLTPIPTVLLGFVSGSILCLFSSRSLFIPFEFALLSLLYSELLRSKYRGWVYRLMRNPFWAGLGIGFGAVILSLLDGMLGGSNSIPQLLASNTVWAITFYSVLILTYALSGLICLLLSRYFKSIWIKPSFLMPAPDEKMITRRFLTGIGPIIFALLVILLVGIWLTVGFSARQVVRQRMAGAAEVAANTIPFFTNSGQNLIIQFARNIPLERGCERCGNSPLAKSQISSIFQSIDLTSMRLVKSLPHLLKWK